MSDGSIIIDTRLDNSGIENGLGKLKGLASKGASLALTSITAVGTALTGLAGAAIKVGSEFEASMGQVSATMGYSVEELHDTGSTAYAEFQKLHDAAKECGKTTQYTASEAAEALNYLALAGYDADKACGTLPTVLNLAAAGGLELSKASDMVTDAMSALGIVADEQGNNVTEFADKMAKTSQKSNTNVAQLGEAILTVGGTASTLSGGVTEMNTALGILADNGIKGAEGGTALRNVINSLTGPTDTAKEAIESLGISVADDKGNMRSLKDIMKDFNGELSKMGKVERNATLKTIFNVRDMKSVSALMSSTITDISDLDSILQQMDYTALEHNTTMRDLANAYDENLSKEDMVNKLMSDFQMTTDQAEVAYEGLQSSFSNGQSRWDELSGYINDADGACSKMAKTMNDNLEGAMKTLGSAAQNLGIDFYESVDNPITSIIDHATDMINQLDNAFLNDGFEGLTNEIGPILSQIVEGIAEYAPTIIDASVNVIQSFLKGLQENSESIGESGAEIVISLAEGIIAVAPELLETGGELAIQIIKGLSEKLPDLIVDATTAITDLADSINDGGVEEFITVGTSIIEKIAEGLAEAFPTLAEKMPDIIAGFTDSIAECTPQLQECGVKVIESLVTGLVNSFPNLLEKAPELMNLFSNNMMMNIAIMSLPGQETINNIISGIQSKIGDLTAKASEVMNNVKSAFLNKVSEFTSIGRNIIDGIVNGISGAVGRLKNKAMEIANSLPEWMKKVLDIHSPSRRMKREIGVYIPQGIQAGIEETTPQLLDATSKMAQQVVTSIKSTMQDGDIIGYSKELAEGIVENFRNVEGTFSELATNLSNAQSNLDNANSKKAEDYQLYKDSIYNMNEFVAQIEDVENKLETLNEQIDNTTDKSTKKNLEAQKKTLESEKKKLEKQKNYYKEEADVNKKAAQSMIDEEKAFCKKVLEAEKAKKDKLVQMAKAVADAIKAQLQERKQAELDSIESELDALEEKYNRESDRIDANSEKKKNRIQEEIDALDDEAEAENRLKEIQEANNNIAVLQAKMNNTASEADKKAYALKIKNAKAALAEKQKEWDRTDEKNALKEEQEEIEERASRRKERLKVEYEEEKENLKKKKEATEDYYSKLLETDAINAQARYVMLQGSNDQLVQLLQSYNPLWQDAGQSLADSLLNGLNSKKESIAEAVADMARFRTGDARGVSGYATGTSSNRLAGMYTVDEKGFELSTNNNPVAYVTKGAGILNHMQSLKAIDKSVDEKLSSRVLPMMQSLKNMVLGQQQMYQFAGAMAGAVNNSSSVREGDINFNVEHFHNDRKDSIENIASELGFHSRKNKRC